MSAEVGAGIAAAVNAWWNSSCGISGFAPLIQTAFATNLAYAALIRAGRFQGAYLQDMANEMAKEIDVFINLLSDENEQYKIIHNNGDDTRASNIVSEAQNNIRKWAVLFAYSAVAAAVLCLIALYICGASSDFKLPIPWTLFLSVLFFAPVPSGLIVTMILSFRCEKNVRNVHNGFLQTIDHVRIEPQEKLGVALDNIKDVLAKKRKGFWDNLLMRNQRDDSL